MIRPRIGPAIHVTASQIAAPHVTPLMVIVMRPSFL
jgi:hypothetical protein